jgi:hypothetical protein
MRNNEGNAIDPWIARTGGGLLIQLSHMNIMPGQTWTNVMKQYTKT